MGDGRRPCTLRGRVMRCRRGWAGPLFADPRMAVILYLIKNCQTAYKPGSVPAAAGDGHSSGALLAEHLARPTRTAAWKPACRACARRAVPIWSCSRWGLPCRLRYRRRGALLPLRFTLAGLAPANPGVGCGGLFSVALSLGSPPPGVTRHRVSMEPGLSSPALAHEGGHPAVWHALVRLLARSRQRARPTERESGGRGGLWVRRLLRSIRERNGAGTP